MLQRLLDTVVRMIPMANRQRASTWSLAALIWAFVCVQAMLPAIHGAQHGVHHARHAAGSVVASADRIADHDASATTPAETDEHGGHRDCDVCKLLLLAKSVGGVAIESNPARLFEPSTVAGEIDTARPLLRRVERAIGPRGPPVA